MKDWIDTVQVGDVVRAKKSGDLRVVRDVTRWPARRPSRVPYRFFVSVSFAIRRCSWTRRPYTVMDRSTLKRLYEPTGTAVRLGSEIDAAIDLEMNGLDGSPLMGDKRRLFCCDAKGVA